MNLKQLSEKNTQQQVPFKSIPVKTGETIEHAHSKQVAGGSETRRELIMRVAKRVMSRRTGNRKK